MMEMGPKKEALKAIVDVMKKLKVEKMKAYNKADDEEPSMEMEMHKRDKKGSDKTRDRLKEKIKEMFASEED